MKMKLLLSLCLLASALASDADTTADASDALTIDDIECESAFETAPTYTPNYVAIGVAAGLIIVVLVLSFVVQKCCSGEAKVGDEEQAIVEEQAANDEMMIELDDGPLCRCCPKFYGLTAAVLTFALLGFAIGAGLNIAFTDCRYKAYQLDIQNQQTITEELTGASIANPDYIQPADDLTAEELDAFYAANAAAIAQAADDLALCAQTKEDWLKVIKKPGDIWVNALKLFVAPLIVFMFVLMPFRVQDYASKGLKALGIYIVTSLFAAVQGTLWVNIFQPGAGMNMGSFDEDGNLNSLASGCISASSKALSTASGDKIREIDSFLGIFDKAVVKDILDAFSGLNVLCLILFFCFLGAMLNRLNKNEAQKAWREQNKNCFKGMLYAIFNMILYVVYAMPYGMLSIVTYQLANMSNEQYVTVLGGVGKYLACQLTGQLVHAFVFYPLFAFICTIKQKGCGGYLDAYKYFFRVFKAPLTAFTTSSSAATLPVTLSVGKAEGGVPASAADIVIPLGSAINMDGTGLGFPVMVGFVAQAFNIQLGFGAYLLVIILAVTSSVGTAPIPNAGLVYITMLLSAANDSLANTDVIQIGLTLIILLDWIVDRAETAQNVWSDLNVARIIGIWEEGKKVEEIELTEEPATPSKPLPNKVN